MGPVGVKRSTRAAKYLNACWSENTIVVRCFGPLLPLLPDLSVEENTTNSSAAARLTYFDVLCRKFFSIGNSTDWRNPLRALGAAATLAQADLNAKGLAKGAEAAACRRRGHLLALSWRIAWHTLSDDPTAQPEPCLEAWGLVRGAGLTCK